MAGGRRPPLRNPDAPTPMPDVLPPAHRFRHGSRVCACGEVTVPDPAMRRFGLGAMLPTKQARREHRERVLAEVLAKMEESKAAVAAEPDVVQLGTRPAGKRRPRKR